MRIDLDATHRLYRRTAPEATILFAKPTSDTMVLALEARCCGRICSQVEGDKQRWAGRGRVRDWRHL